MCACASIKFLIDSSHARDNLNLLLKFISQSVIDVEFQHVQRSSFFFAMESKLLEAMKSEE